MLGEPPVQKHCPKKIAVSFSFAFIHFIGFIFAASCSYVANHRKVSHR